MEKRSDEKLREVVRASYASVAESGGQTGCCGPAPVTSSCCGPAPVTIGGDYSGRIGYSQDEMNAVPEGADMGLGCGNPSAIAALRPTDVVVDLGSGPGFDCFLAARQVTKGHVIGIDMTPEMLAKARENAAKIDLANVEFRLGEIEHLPVADNTADVIISNCVINLSPDKAAVIGEAFRVLVPGGRLAISDVVATADIPEHFTLDEDMICGCMGAAAAISDLKTWLAEAGFTSIDIDVQESSRAVIAEWAPGSGIEAFVASASITAVKPVP
jgi:SAM-dependent methyltransferase